MAPTGFEAIVNDPNWLAHRYDVHYDAFHFRRLTRAEHREAVFITDQYLADAKIVAVRRSEAMAAAPTAAPIHFLLHSGFCCSTLLAKALDVAGVATALKEPVLLNDVASLKHRGLPKEQQASVLRDCLRLLARPFESGEAVIIKPSSVVNFMAPAMLDASPHSKALLLYAPLPLFLNSIIRKGFEGRHWVRDLLVKQLREGMAGMGLSAIDLAALTDLQAAALTWLVHHALFRSLGSEYGDRVRVLESEHLLEKQQATLFSVSEYLSLELGATTCAAETAFNTHSKSGKRFGKAERAAAQEAAAISHHLEISIVVAWTAALAERLKLPFTHTAQSI